MHIRPGQVSPVIGDLALLDQVRGEDDGWIWIDLEHADAQEESHLLSERFGIHLAGDTGCPTRTPSAEG